jgi:hypothetical protein
MCGRYVALDVAAVERHFNLTRGGGELFDARHNAAPANS